MQTYNSKLKKKIKKNANLSRSLKKLCIGILEEGITLFIINFCKLSVSVFSVFFCSF